MTVKVVGNDNSAVTGSNIIFLPHLFCGNLAADADLNSYGNASRIKSAHFIPPF